MTGQVQRLLPALLIALVLHGVLLSRKLGEDMVTPAAKALQRITVSLGTRKVVNKSPVEKKQLTPSEEKKEVLLSVKPKLKEYGESALPVATAPPVHIPKPSRRKTVSRENSAKVKPLTAASPSAEFKKSHQPSSSSAEHKEHGDPQESSAAVVLHQDTPLYLVNPPPEYPRLARRRGLEGVVLLEVLVDNSGRVVDIRLSRTSGHALLDKAAMKGVQRWQFIPGTMNGRPQEMWVEIPVRFKLR